MPSADDQAIDAVVIAILAEVKSRGDEALLSYTKQFDRLSANRISDLEIKQVDLEAAYRSLPSEQAKALEFAAQRVRAYHEKQKEMSDQLAEKVVILQQKNIDRELDNWERGEWQPEDHRASMDEVMRKLKKQYQFKEDDLL